jgi:hypothetical protein
MGETMATTCHVKIVDEGPGPARQLTFEEVPRVGEFVCFSRDGRRDDAGVLHTERFKVKHVFHMAGNSKVGPMTLLDVVVDG